MPPTYSERVVIAQEAILLARQKSMGRERLAALRLDVVLTAVESAEFARWQQVTMRSPYTDVVWRVHPTPMDAIQIMTDTPGVPIADLNYPSATYCVLPEPLPNHGLTAKDILIGLLLTIRGGNEWNLVHTGYIHGGRLSQSQHEQYVKWTVNGGRPLTLTPTPQRATVRPHLTMF